MSRRWRLLVGYLVATHLAVYLTFPQFALVPKASSGAMAAMGAGGLISALIAALVLDSRPVALRTRLAILGVISLGTFVAPLNISWDESQVPVAIMAILGTAGGGTLILLMSCLREVAPRRRQGLYLGGIGAAAYMTANLILAADAPFDADSAMNIATIAASLGTLAGLVTVATLAIDHWARPQPAAALAIPPSPTRTTFRRLARYGAAVLGPLALLVFIDSYSFHAMGHAGAYAGSPILRTPTNFIEYGMLHGFFALLAGALYPALGRRRLLALAFAAMVVTTTLLALNVVLASGEGVRWMYSVVIGFYTVVFLSYFADPISDARPHLAQAVAIGLTGWIANPAGIVAIKCVDAHFADRPLLVFALPIPAAIIGLAWAWRRSRHEPSFGVESLEMSEPRALAKP
ncbi:hypothetical protein KDL45_12565 [bacterium]|nr:hypothetical protein [bacterium]